MGSQARSKFEQSRADVQRLLEIHQDLGGSGPGRRARLEVLNKAGVVLVCALWEAYCEDLADEALNAIVTKATDSTALPRAFRETIAKDLKAENDKLAVWRLADGGWRQELVRRRAALTLTRNRNLNTPKHMVVDALFAATVGAGPVSAAWSWSNMTPMRARNKLDRYVTLRGDIAHRGRTKGGVLKDHVSDFLGHITGLVASTDLSINRHIRQLLGQGLW